MKTKNPLKISVIGAGMVGTAIGYLLKQAGHCIISFADISPAHLKRAKNYTGAKCFHNSAQAASLADCLLLATPDDRIGAVCAEIAADCPLPGKKVLHLSGAGGLDLLDAASRAGACVGSIHPLQSFSSIEGAIKNIPGSYFGVTARAGAKKLASGLVGDLGGIPMKVAPEQKPLYHAAACIASNYLVSLMSVVESIYLSIGFSEKDARQAYLPLVYGSLSNIQSQGCAQALTGPIARGDSGTVKKHLDAFASHHPELSSLYTNMGIIAVQLARQKGALNTKQANQILKLLKGAKK